MATRYPISVSFNAVEYISVLMSFQYITEMEQYMGYMRKKNTEIKEIVHFIRNLNLPSKMGY